MPRTPHRFALLGAIAAALAALVAPGAAAERFTLDDLDRLMGMPEGQDATQLIVRPKTPEGFGAVLANGVAKRLPDRARTRLAARTKDYFPEVDQYVVTAPQGMSLYEYACELLETGEYEYVVPDMVCRPLLTPNDVFFSLMYHHDLMESEAAWDITTGDPNLIVAVVDSGIDLDHPDLAPLLVDGYNSATGTPQQFGGLVDDIATSGHGTAVAGCMTAIGNNGLSVVGVGWGFKLMPIRATNSSDGTAISTALYSGARWAADNGARVVNISYSGVENPGSQDTGEYLAARGAVLVYGAGNENEQHDFFDYPDVIIAAATDRNDIPTSFTAEGRGVDVAAPGRSVWTTKNGGGVQTVNGTSFAAPLTAGVAAMVLSVNPSLTSREVAAAIREGADDLGAPGEDRIYGSGRINLLGALTSPCTTGVGGTDCNSNGVIDECGVFTLEEQDCDEDGTPDDCQLASDPSLDCDGDGVFDTCQIFDNFSLDCDNNGVLDTCEIDATPGADCDGNGILDRCQISISPALDCDRNDVLDTCQIAADPSSDCDGDGLIDACIDQEYIVTRSDEPGGPVYDGFNLTTGQIVSLPDDGFSQGAAIPFGFPDQFPFYGQPRFNFRIASNGFLSLGAGFPPDDGCCAGRFIPSPSEPNNLIAGLWTDLDPSAGGVVRTDLTVVPDGRLSRVVQFTDVPIGIVPGARANFQIRTFPNGQIELHYGEIDVPGVVMTGGIEETLGVAGVRTHYSSNPPAAFSAVRISPPNDCNNNGEPDSCDIASDPLLDCNLDGIIDDCQNPSAAAECENLPERCLGDTDGDYDADATDFVAMLVGFGDTEPLQNPGADLDGSGTVDSGDFIELLVAFGTEYDVLCQPITP
ncbi:MAG: S8 family serine peptidase [Planctomycetota bacterium]